MDKVIVTALLIIGAVTAAVVVIVTVTPAISGSAQATGQAANEASVRIKTDIEIIAVASDVPGTQIDAWIKNVGTAQIMALDKSDVFVITPGTRFDAMAHAAGGGADTWTESPPDAPWKRGDTLHIVITLADALAAGDHSLRVSTPNGVTADKFFSR